MLGTVTQQRFAKSFLLILAIGISLIFFFMIRSFLVAVLLAAIVGAALITGSLVFVVTARTAELKAGYALHALHQQRARLARQRSELRLEIAALTRPERLAQIAPGLGLAAPERAQVLPPREVASTVEVTP